MATRRRASKSTLTGNITDLQRRVRYLQAKPVPGRLANQVVTRSAIQPRAVSTDQIALAAITNDQVAADAIKQEQLDALSVGNPELQDNAVLNRNIAKDAVNQESIEINSVGNGEMQDDSIGSPELQDNSVGNSEIANDAVGSGEIQMDAVGQSEIAPNSVGTAELQTNAVTTDKIQDDQITKAKMQRDSVGSREIINGSVTTAQLDTAAVGTAKIADSAVTTVKIANSSVTTAKIANLNVTNAKIEQGTINIDKVNTAFPGLSASRGIRAGIGINTSFNDGNNTLVIGAIFGTARLQIPNGDHTHSFTTSQALSGVNRHSHTGTTGTPSTIKVKKEITTHSLENIKNLLKLEPKRYKYKRNKRDYQQARNREWMYGYMAEELIELGFSEPIGYGKEGEPETLDYGLMSMLVLELVKVQQSEIDSLKEEVLRLKDAK
jgi:hypothetical protein